MAYTESGHGSFHAPAFGTGPGPGLKFILNGTNVGIMFSNRVLLLTSGFAGVLYQCLHLHGIKGSRRDYWEVVSA